VQVDPIKLTLKAPVTKRLKLKSDGMLSSFALNFNLRRYTKDYTAEHKTRVLEATLGKSYGGAQEKTLMERMNQFGGETLTEGIDQLGNAAAVPQGSYFGEYPALGSGYGGGSYAMSALGSGYDGGLYAGSALGSGYNGPAVDSGFQERWSRAGAYIRPLLGST